MMWRVLMVFWGLAAGAAQAVSGSWVADSVGVSLGHGGVRLTSPSLRPPNALPDANARITSISWRYRLASSAPAGLQVELCMPARCMALEGGSGRSEALRGELANGEFYFVYSIQTRGAVFPPLRVLSNQLIVNYQ
ncbi:Flagellar protein flhE precursor [Serratia odorifera]|uniref:Flagellar protein flhE n=2 Tax=Serratia odorifera TaxID=618 RepID=A0A447KVQ7_SEROD|nr:Flagellar protein flhE precursor [Serratia odorifera]